MVTRLVLLVILGFVAALYFPDSRQAMWNRTMPVIEPMLIWNAEREVMPRPIRGASSYEAWPDSFSIRSDGPDRLHGSEDDIGAIKRRPF